MISTDVLSEGQNLQDCAYLVNYDLHWNPTRMVQRAGRIDRIGTEFSTLFIRNMFPDAGTYKISALVQLYDADLNDLDNLPEEKYRLFESVATILGIGSDMVRVFMYFSGTNSTKEGEHVGSGRIRGGSYRGDYAC